MVELRDASLLAYGYLPYDRSAHAAHYLPMHASATPSGVSHQLAPVAHRIRLMISTGPTGVFHSADGGKSWTKCATPKKLMAASVDDVKAAVRACGANLPGKAEL